MKVDELVRPTAVLAGDDVPAESKYRTASLVFGAVLGTAMGPTPMVIVVFGIFLVPISMEFAWSRTAVAGAFTALAIGAACAYPLAGRLADRFGARPILVLGYFLMGSAMVGLSFVPANPVVFYGAFALTGVISALPSNMLINKLLAEGFEQGRGFWMGLVSGVGNGGGASITPVIAATLMERYGWRGAFRSMALLELLVALPIAWATLRSPRNRLHNTVDGKPALEGVTLQEALRSPVFWMILSTVPVAGGCLTAVFTNTVPILLSHGVELADATPIVAVFALVCTVFEPLVGYFLDRSIKPGLVAPFYICACLGLILLSVARQPAGLMTAGVLSGIGLGAEFSVLPFVLSRYFGLRELGSVSGVAFMAVLVSSALAPIGLNLAYDRLGSYSLSLYVLAVLLAYNAVVFVFMGPYRYRAKSQHQ